MFSTQVLGQCDFYKTSHYKMYPNGTTKIYSNLTPRKSRIPGIDGVVVFGIQYFVLEYLIEQWNKNFFNASEVRVVGEVEYDEEIARYPGETYPVRQRVDLGKEGVIKKYKRLMDNTLGKDSVDMDHIEQLWDLGYMPLKIKALPEGKFCPIGVPCMTITNTVDHAYWLVNYLETILSCTVWQPMTSATIANHYRKLLNKYAMETTGSTEFVQWQGHDFSMRGMSSLETACTSGAAHLLSFTGTDTVPAIEWLEQYYGADVEKELVGASVPATEHSVMCMGLKDGELATFSRLLDLYPTGILSVVSDTWDLWNVVKRGGICEQLKDKILRRGEWKHKDGTTYTPCIDENNREYFRGSDGIEYSDEAIRNSSDITHIPGKLVIRPDSGDPCDIICGNNTGMYKSSAYYNKDQDVFESEYDKIPATKGVIECLWDIFGGTISETGYKVLDQRIGAIYGDSINPERATQICERLMAKGFASTNIVFGIGSFTYQMNTRDTFGFAMKATYGEVLECTCNSIDQQDSCKHYHDNPPDWCTKKPEGREIFKDPITDSGEKKSARGLLRVDYNENGKIVLYQQQTKEQEEGGLLETIFLDGKLTKRYTLAEVRENLRKND